MDTELTPNPTRPDMRSSRRPPDPGRWIRAMDGPDAAYGVRWEVPTCPCTTPKPLNQAIATQLTPTLDPGMVSRLLKAQGVMVDSPWALMARRIGS